MGTDQLTQLHPVMQGVTSTPAKKEFITIPLFDHFIVDVDTKDTLCGKVIISVAAVEFEIVTGKTGRTFYKLGGANVVDTLISFHKFFKSSVAQKIWISSYNCGFPIWTQYDQESVKKRINILSEEAIFGGEKMNRLDFCKAQIERISNLYNLIN